jgi:Zinc finger, C3HC4 type (RING finger)
MSTVQIGNKHTRILAIRHLILERKNILKLAKEDPFMSSFKILYLGFDMRAVFNLDDDGSITFVLFHELHNSIRLSILLYEYDDCEYDIVNDNNKAAFAITNFFETGYVRLCSCGELSIDDTESRCKSCFKLWFINDKDICSICMEREGVWSKLPCDHILHKICADKIVTFGGGRCPLCRASFNPEDVVHGFPFFEKVQDYEKYLQQ